MKTVREILNRKGNEIFSVSPESSIYDAIKLMADKEVGALLVLEEGKLVGVISERDYARKVALEGKSSKDSSVKEIMSPHVIYVHPERNPEECMALMVAKKVRHLPVVENKNLIGVVSIGDVVKGLIDEREFVIDQLVHYITDTPAIKTEHAKTDYNLSEAPPSLK